ENGPDRPRPLLVIERVLPGGDLAPSGKPIGGDLHQDDVARIRAGKAGLKEMHQRHADLAKDNLVEFHRNLFISTAPINTSPRSRFVRSGSLRAHAKKRPGNVQRSPAGSSAHAPDRPLGSPRYSPDTKCAPLPR